MWLLGTWVTSGLGSAGRAAGLKGLRGLFQPKGFRDYSDNLLKDFAHRMTFHFQLL